MLRVPALALVCDAAAIRVDVVESHASEAAIQSVVIPPFPAFNSTDGLFDFCDKETAAVCSKTGSVASTFGSTESRSSGRKLASSLNLDNQI